MDTGKTQTQRGWRQQEKALFTMDKKNSMIARNADGSLTIVGDIFLLAGTGKVILSKADSFRYNDAHEQ